MNNRLWVCLLSIVLLLSTVSNGWSVERSRVEEKQFSMSPGGTVTVTADEGGIDVHTWEREEVYLKMTKRAWGKNDREANRNLDELEVEIREEINHLIVRELDRDRTGGSFHFFDLFDPNFWQEQGNRGGVIDFELIVPENTHLRLRCDEGDVDVSRIQGKMDIEVDEGCVNLEDIVTSQIVVSVDEGDVNIRRINSRDRGMMTLETDEGSIRIEEGQIGEADIGTDEGDILFRNIEVERFWLNTDEGNIEIDFYPLKDGRYRAETDEGDVEVSLPDNANLQVVLQTDEGRIDSDFDLNIQRRDEAERAEGSIGRGEGTLRLYIEEGDIRLLKHR
ncbi:DUF4097 family beta strand repeat protein [bacterium]|nr:DUF4097 family beta strand repeat protein [bacterium]